MSVNARTLPIVLVLGGVVIISAAISAYAFGQRVDLVLNTIVAVAFIIGVVAILLGAGLY